MSHDFLIGGAILSPIVPELVIAVLLTGLISVALMRLGFYRLVWHRPLVELALFCILLGLLVTVADGSPSSPPTPLSGAALS